MTESLALPARFWSKVDGRASVDCWQWLGGKTQNGYGQFHLNGGMRMAHRIAYAALVGPIPEGLELDHLCRNRACVNPTHLEPVTRRVNQLRGLTLAAACSARRACPEGHPLNEGNLRPSQQRAGKRGCLTCAREHSRLTNALIRRACTALGMTRRAYGRAYGWSLDAARMIVGEEAA